MICVSLAEKTTRGILASLPFHPFAEIRLDAVARLTAADIERIFVSHPRLIATCRPGRVVEPKRIARLLEAVAAGAAYVDLEIETASADMKRIARAARARNCLLIVSSHNMKRTPARAVLEDIRRRGFKAGADIVKIACASSGASDNARLLALLDYPRPVVAIGLGPSGKITRLAAPLLGAPFTYAAAAAGKETAAGQIEAAGLLRAWKEWENA